MGNVNWICGGGEAKGRGETYRLWVGIEWPKGLGICRYCTFLLLVGKFVDEKL